MSTQSQYDAWSAQYDTNENKTRDLEAVAIRKLLAKVQFAFVLEIGAGTGKNTVWLCERAENLLAVDISAEMLAKAADKIEALEESDCEFYFMQADITEPWSIDSKVYDLVSFSLVLEHIEDLDHIFKEVARVLVSGGHVYLGELHPFKQYMGSKARFEGAEGEVVVNCYNHHISDFIQVAARHGIALVTLEEFFDGDDRSGVPRILGMVLRKG